MIADNWWLLSIGGLISGLLAGLLGIGGGTVLVPLLVTLGYVYDSSVGTSSLAIVLTSFSGTIQNWRMGNIDLQRLIYLGLPAIFTAQFGAWLVEQLPNYFKEAAFGVLLLINIFLIGLKKRLMDNENGEIDQKLNPTVARIVTGALAGLLAGLFGVGGGVILVPLQMLLLGERIKVAIQTSLGVVGITSISAAAGHATQGNVLFWVGIILGVGGLIGAQFSTRFLPQIPDRWVSLLFRVLLVSLAIYFFWRAWHSYQGA
ncbi:sulfite exporter TauE/SafE family protein [Oscillatoria salina]|uniref:sulfite exporter TauE/SafE family protein n=1 Tax=Oscillatoria salina TaxID=331517 RepID=UPI0013BBF7E8|nr:sulfite exporter TauE/SafE family protein [Oscillatoria salina]MBZ8182655.1 sulfite exporter TauE/SafE family protein [Oscillatoria salina IIICB1]NET89881.1 sulfite exporter TauE/SafE family protein [Kamptonema sp. SIO1D9]